MKEKLIYHGELKLTPALSEEEVQFLNTWQTALAEKFSLLDSTKDDDLKSQYYNNIKDFIGLPLDDKQLWVLHFSFNPLISFEKDKIIIHGEHEKGQLRDALLIYQHFFFSEEPFMTKYLPYLTFMKEHTFDGIIQSEKFSYKTGHTQWCYIAEKSEITSVNAKTIDEYLANPKQFPKEEKEDKSHDRIERYYPKNSPLMRFLALNVKLEPKNIHIKKAKI